MVPINNGSIVKMNVCRVVLILLSRVYTSPHRAVFNTYLWVTCYLYLRIGIHIRLYTIILWWWTRLYCYHNNNKLKRTYLSVWSWSSPARCRLAVWPLTGSRVVRRYRTWSIRVCRPHYGQWASWGGCRTRGGATCQQPPAPATIRSLRPCRMTSPPAASCCCSPSSSTFHTNRVTPVRTTTTDDDGWRRRISRVRHTPAGARGRQKNHP